MCEICNEFNRFDYHDSKLLTFQLLRRGTTHEFVEDFCFDIELSMDANNNYEKAKLILKDCRIILLDLDLVGKQECSDHIASAICQDSSELKTNLINKYFQYEQNALTGYLHFQIILIPPGGSADVFAKNFELLKCNRP